MDRLPDIDTASDRAFERAVVDVAPVIALLLDADGRIVRFNAHMETLSGYALDEVKGEDWFDTFIPEHEQRRIRALFEVAVAGRRTQGNINAIRTKSGEERLIKWFDTELFTAEGEPAGLAAIGLDITEERQRAELEQQRQKMEALGTLASGVAHDFNNLLMGIIGVANKALPGDEDETREALSEIRRSARQGAAIVEQLLTVARRGETEGGRALVDEVLTSRRALLAALLREDIELSLSSDSDGARVGLPEGQLEQILLNLATNARHAMPRGGRFTVATRRLDLSAASVQRYHYLAPGPFVEIEVTDDGEGMDEQVLGRAFEPFFTTKEVGEGTGLGLSTVYGIVQRVGGHIEAHSELGAGSRFLILLPVVDDEPERVVPVPRHEPSERRARILVVEDEELIRFTLRHYLEEAGHEVLEAADGNEALRQVEAGPIDVLLTDMVLPKLQGDELAERVRSHHPEAGVVFMSAHPKRSLLEEGRVSEHSLVLGKPFESEELLAAVQAAIAAVSPPS